MPNRRTKRKCSAISKSRRFSKKEAKETDDVQNEAMSKMEEEEAGRMWDHLPHGVLVKILLRLPVKSLVRFRCVCKDWYSLISSNSFITTHANHAVSWSHDKNMSSLVFRYGIDTDSDDELERCHDFFCLHSDDASFGYNDNFTGLNLPRFGPFLGLDPPLVVGWCNGLLCTISDGCDYQLWNPSIRRALRLPEPNLASTGNYSVYGLGYNPSSDEIKLVRLVYLLPNRDPHGQVPPQVEIYTLKSSCWRCITAPAPPYVCYTSSLSVFANGAAHWVAYTSVNQGTFRNLIMAFDMVDEVFRDIPLPTCFVGIRVFDMSLALRDGLLCLAPHYPPREQQSFSIWIMKEYGVGESWTKLFDIHICGLERVVGLRKMGEVLVANREGELLLYEPNTQEVRPVGFRSNSTEGAGYGFGDSYYLWEECAETMILLNGVSK